MATILGSLWSAPMVAQAGPHDLLHATTPHWTPADTGRMAWGHQDFSRYRTPEACDRAVADVEKEFSRSPTIDVLAVGDLRRSDTLSTAARLVAKQCGARFLTAPVDTREFPHVLALALAMGNDTVAASLVTRQLRHDTTTAGQAWTLAASMTAELTATPARLRMAQALQIRLDTLAGGTHVVADSVRIAQVRGHLALLGYWRVVYDTMQIRKEATAARVLIRALPSAVRDQVNALAPYDALLSLANDAHDLAGSRQLIKSIILDLGSWRGGQETQFYQDQESLLDIRATLYGQPTRALKSAYWFNTGGTAHPAPGKVSLLLHVSHGCGTECVPLYQAVKALHRRYGAALDITVLTETLGFGVVSGPIPPDEEAKDLERYFLGYLRLPAALLVDKTPIKKRADGRLVRMYTPLNKMFDHWHICNTVLIDRDGKIQWFGSLTSSDEIRQVTAEINRLMSVPLHP